MAVIVNDFEIIQDSAREEDEDARLNAESPAEEDNAPTARDFEDVLRWKTLRLLRVRAH